MYSKRVKQPGHLVAINTGPGTCKGVGKGGSGGGLKYQHSLKIVSSVLVDMQYRSVELAVLLYVAKSSTCTMH